MHKGFTKTTLGLLAAALLSSSAFAVGPTLDAIPNVFITDETKAPSPVPDDGDGATPATNVYRFTDAFVLGDYVDFDPDNDLDEAEHLPTVEWLFQEYAHNNTAPGNARTGSARTIAIGESVATAQLGFNSATEATYTDVINSSLPEVGNLGSALDFVNQALSPDVNDYGTSPSGNFAFGTDAAVIELFVAHSSAANLTDSTMFTVYTTNDDSFADGDQVTFSSNIWSAELCIDDMAGWEVEEISPTDTPGRFTPTPTVAGTSRTGALAGNTLTAAGTTGLRAETDATPTGNTGQTQLQYVSWKSLRRDIPGMVSVPVAADNTLFLIRWTLSADAATVAAATTNPRGTSVQLPMVRLRAGEVATTANGQSREHFGAVGLNNIVTAGREIRTYFYAKEGGNYDTTEGFDDNLLPPSWGQDDDPPVVFGLNFDILDTVTSTDDFAATVGGQRLYGLTLDKVEVYSSTRSALGTGTVVFNQGVNTFSVASGETAPTNDSYSQFDLTAWGSRDEGAGTRGTTFAPPEDNVAGTTNTPLSYSIIAGTALTVATWDTRDYAASAALAPPDGLGMGEEIVTVDNDVLVAIDVWLSSPQGGTPNNLLPGVYDSTTGGVSATRFGFQTDIWGGTGSGEGPTGLDDPDMPGAVNLFRQGRTGLFEFNAGNREQYDTADLLPSTYALQTAARQLSFFFEPQAVNDADGIDALSFRPTIQSYSAPAQAGDLAAQVNGTIQIQRVVVTTYPLSDPDPICP